MLLKIVLSSYAAGAGEKKGNNGPPQKMPHLRTARTRTRHRHGAALGLLRGEVLADGREGSALCFRIEDFLALAVEAGRLGSRLVWARGQVVDSKARLQLRQQRCTQVMAGPEGRIGK